MLAASTEKVEGEASALSEKLSEVREEMQGLKVELYARFGKGINLDV